MDASPPALAGTGGPEQAHTTGPPPRDFPLTATAAPEALFPPGEAACPPDAASPDLPHLMLAMIRTGSPRLRRTANFRGKVAWVVVTW
ncbi:protein of unknown function [Streptomyces sp. KY75]|nr:protein of unknown function [Streptomyces sp. KY70]CAD5974454.1 protein of unknown function [Streptomyces sp. KY75]